MVFGPTAAGKSDVADRFAEEISEAFSAWAPVVAVDSMQVYREIPVITNQARRRPAEMVGVVSVDEEWTVARHKHRVEKLLAGFGTPHVLDAGTGMYLNAIVLDVPLASKAPEEVREKAKRLAGGAENPRRAAREAELELMGAPARGSIWAGEERYDAAYVYLRPSRDVVDRNIATRSAKIVREGVEEAQALSGHIAVGELAPNPSVREAVGVREMLAVVSGGLEVEEAEDLINTRTRRLARRQMRWFDKLTRRLPADRVYVFEKSEEAGRRHDIIRAWMRRS